MDEPSKNLFLNSNSCISEKAVGRLSPRKGLECTGAIKHLSVEAESPVNHTKAKLGELSSIFTKWVKITQTYRGTNSCRPFSRKNSDIPNSHVLEGFNLRGMRASTAPKITGSIPEKEKGLPKIERKTCQQQKTSHPQDSALHAFYKGASARDKSHHGSLYL